MIYKKPVVPAFYLTAKVVNIVLQGFVNAFAHRHDAVFVVLSLPDKNCTAVKIHVFDSKIIALAQPQPATVKKRKNKF